MECLAVKINFFGTCLTRKKMTVGLPVIENIPLPIYKGDTPVCITALIERFCIAIDANVGIGNQNASEMIIAHWAIGDCPAQFVHPGG